MSVPDNEDWRERSRHLGEPEIIPREGEQQVCARCKGVGKTTASELAGMTFYFCDTCLAAKPIPADERRKAEEMQAHAEREAAVERARQDANAERRVTVVIRTNSRRKVFQAVHELIETAEQSTPLRTRCGFEVLKEYDDIATRKRVTCEDCDGAYFEAKIVEWMERGVTLEQMRDAIERVKQSLSEGEA
jgi:hypothetical protein